MKKNKKTTGLNTPQNYFEDFEERLFLKISEDIIPKESGFKVPDNYFDQLENTILNKVNEKEIIHKSKVISLFSKKTLLYAASIAACATIVLSLFNLDNTIIDLNDIQLSVIEEFIEEENISFDTYDLTSLLIEDDDLTLENDLFSEETLEKYLLESIDDTSLFIE
ncbi:MAG: hypothetical protein ACI9SJ_000940 [Flavobacteriaceae bacterium]|jgi:hypothetical protein|uniref:hypothetical protein n=1 Tax=Candidatus Marifrigoribacter sp. Uisw_064 TaxID=3230970 RepID=UPI003ADD870D